MDTNNDEVEIKLTKEQYKSLILYLYSAERCGLKPDSLGIGKEGTFSNLLEYLCSFGRNLNLPETDPEIEITSPLPISEQELANLQNEIYAWFEKSIATGLAQKFAEHDFKDFFNRCPDDSEGSWIRRRNIVIERMRFYIKEFEENGIANL